MSHTYTACIFHAVFSTKDRENLIPTELLQRTWSYIGGIADTNQFTAMQVGGIENHLHALLSLPSTMPIAKAVQLIKSGSAKWLNEQLPAQRTAIWQQGYSAFSIGVSQVDRTVAYIQNQREHHAMRDYKLELLLFLKKNKITYDSNYLWD